MLKQSDDTLSKVWKVQSQHKPFYDGSKGEFTKDLQHFICLYNDNVVILDWNVGSVITHLMDETDENKDIITCFCMHPNGMEVVISTQHKLLQHWKLSHGSSSSDVTLKYHNKECVRSIKSHTMPVLCMCYDPSGTLVATGSADRTVRVWDVEKGYCTHNFKDNTDIIHTVQFSTIANDQLQLFSLSDDNTIRILDLNQSKCISTLREHMSLPTCVSTSTYGSLLASVSRDKVINLYDTKKWHHLKTVAVMEELESVVILTQKHADIILNNCSERKKSKKSSTLTYVLLVAGQKGIVKFFRVECSSSDSSITCDMIHQLSVTCSQTTTHSTSVATASIPSLQSVKHMSYNVLHDEVVVMTADHVLYSYKIVSEPHTGVDVSNRFKLQRSLIGFNDDILDMAYIYSNAPDNDDVNDDDDDSDDDDKKKMKGSNGKNGTSVLAIVTNSPQIKLMNVDTYDTVMLDGHTDIVLSVDVSPNGCHIITSSKDKTVKYWDLLSNICVGVGEGHTDAVNSVGIHKANATHLSKKDFAVSGGVDKILKRWSLINENKKSSSVSKIGSKDADAIISLTCTHSVRAHDKEINTVTVSPNDSLIATGSQDRTIRLWRASDLTSVARLNGHKRSVWKVVFSPVDRCLASASGDRTVKLWSIADYTCIRTFEGHTASVLCLQFVNAGLQLLSGGADGLIRLWTIHTGDCENTFDEHHDKVWAIAVSPADEKLFYSGSSDSRILSWNDVTEVEESERLHKQEELLLVEQQMRNDIRNKRFGKALVAALSLGHSQRTLTILSAIIEEEASDQASSSTSDEIHNINTTTLWDRLDYYVRTMTDKEVEQLVIYMKDWNTNARYSFISQLLMNSLIKIVKVERLLSMRSIAEAVPAILSYSDRHLNRVDKLHQGSYLLSYITSLISLLPINEQEVDEGNAVADSVSKYNSSGNTGKKSKLQIFGPLADDNNSNDSNDDSDSNDRVRSKSDSASSKKNKAATTATAAVVVKSKKRKIHK